jgi:hypothetical protein
VRQEFIEQVFFITILSRMQEAIMEGELRALVALELKYCESCGGLWLRPKGDAGVYCMPCDSIMAELPPPRVKRSTPRGVPQVEVQIEVKELMAFCTEGGAA